MGRYVRCMRTNEAVQGLMEAARNGERCCYGTTRATRRALMKRARSGELKRTYCNTYMPSAQWDELEPPHRVLYTARALGLRHKTWVFAGHVAVAAHGLDHPWTIHDGTIVIAVADSPTVRPSSRLRRIYAPHAKTCTRAGIVVTSVERTLVDCALTYPFVQILPMFDSALRMGSTTKEAIVDECDRLNRDVGAVMRAVHYADARSENGGESECRAVIIEAGLMIPELQVEFNVDGNVKRVDFIWRLPDGRVIVLEFDGMRKYVDPTMTDRRSVRQVVADEREREDMLRRAGVTTIIRTDYDEVRARRPLIAKLIAAGIPHVPSLWP